MFWYSPRAAEKRNNFLIALARVPVPAENFHHLFLVTMEAKRKECELGQRRQNCVPDFSSAALRPAARYTTFSIADECECLSTGSGDAPGIISAAFFTFVGGSSGSGGGHPALINRAQQLHRVVGNPSRPPAVVGEEQLPLRRRPGLLQAARYSPPCRRRGRCRCGRHRGCAHALAAHTQLLASSAAAR